MKKSTCVAVTLAVTATLSSLSLLPVSAQETMTVHRTKYQMGYSNGYTHGYATGASLYRASHYHNGYYYPGYYQTGLLGLLSASYVAPAFYAPTIAASCAAKYRSYDPVSNTFMSYDGNRYYCQL